MLRVFVNTITKLNTKVKPILNPKANTNVNKLRKFLKIPKQKAVIFEKYEIA